jgi:tetratricopeptide (TPR) repeat protein
MNVPLYVVGSIFFIFAILLLYIRFYRKPKQLQKIQEQILAGDIRSSIRDLKAIIIKQGGSIDAHYLLAECYRRERNCQMAIVEYRYCLNLTRRPLITSEKEIREGLVECYMTVGKEDEALQELFELERLEPKNAKHLFRIAKIFYSRGNLEQAVTYFDRTVKADPFNIESLGYLGMIMFHANQIKEAVVYLTRAVKYDNRNYRSLYYLGRVYMEGKDFSKALTYFESAQLSPEYRIRSFLQKAICYREINDVENAADEFQKAIESSKGKNQSLLLTARYLLADVYEKNGKLAEAVEQWELIEKVKPSYKDIQGKLDKYHALRVDDNIKDFLVSPTPIYRAILDDVVNYLGYEVVDLKHIGTGVTNITATPKETSSRTTKPERVYIKVFRDTVSLGVNAIKSVAEEAKALRCMSAICISPVKFLSDAKEFTVARQIRLIGGDDLAKILGEIRSDTWEKSSHVPKQM